MELTTELLSAPIYEGPLHMSPPEFLTAEELTTELLSAAD
jgi:hypothetical protein